MKTVDLFAGKSLYTTPQEVLKKVFGYAAFRPLQEDIINAVLAHTDTLAVMPTGGGKSLCYQVPALLLPGMTVVVSPLIALMQDQVSALQTAGVDAVVLNSSLDWTSYKANMDRVRSGAVKLLYTAPEALFSARVQELLADVHVDCITIDEAHCISEWGHDFRPEYRRIAEIRKLFPQAVCLALTATATESVRKDIVKNLAFKHCAVITAGFDRSNIYLEARPKKQPEQQVLSYIGEHAGESGIIYCFSRKQVDSLTDFLQARHLSVLPYHAGLSDTERAKNQELFISDKVEIMVATVAFGMGINKPDVRYVIHFDMPKSLEQYYQEIGRAGRDGEPSSALLLYSAGDIHKIRFFWQDKAEGEVAKAEQLLQGMLHYVESKTCRREQLLAYFGDTLNAGCADSAERRDGCCDICSRGAAADCDVTVPAQKFLSCVVRTNQRYGAAYIIDILLGSKQKRIAENGHTKLSTWGIGRDIARDTWFEIAGALVDAGYLTKSPDYNVLSLTPQAKDSLAERTPILLPVSPPAAGDTAETIRNNSRLIKKNDSRSRRSIPATDKTGLLIYELLKDLRRTLAMEAAVPPYIIFPDRTIEELAIEKPQTAGALIGIHGIGTVKAGKFGGAILRVINEALGR